MKFLSGRVYKDICGELYLRDSDAKVHDVLQALRDGLKPRDFAQRFPKVTDSDIHTCKAMAVMALPDCPEYRLNRANNGHSPEDSRLPIKILFDENLS